MGDNRQSSPRGSLNLDTFHQGPGPEQADSPRGSTISGSSKGESNVTSHRPMVPQSGYPIQGQVLVDPATGQHYIVPQPAYYQPMQPMQPMYYPPPQPAPMFYPYQQQGYHHAPMMIPPYGASPLMQQRPTLHGSRPSIPSEEAFEVPPPPSPSRSFRSTPPRVYPSPPPSSISSSATAQYRDKIQHQQSLPVDHQPEDPESGFRRNSVRGSFERPHSMTSQPNRPMEEWRPAAATAQPPQKQERTPLYGGPPPWWQYQDEANNVNLMATQSDVEGRHRNSPSATHHHRQHQTSVSDVEGPTMRPATAVSPSAAAAAAVAQLTNVMQRAAAAKPVRMDFDFKPQTAVVEEPVARPATTTTAAKAVRMEFDFKKMPAETPPEKKVVPRVPATAFTVNFDNPEGEVSLQDAARKSAQAKRILSRRTGQMTQQEQRQEPPPPEPSHKKYLLQKLLSGKDEEPADVEDLVDEVGSDFYKRDVDTVSDAGTFIVDTSKRQSLMPMMHMPQKIVEGSDDDSVTDDSEDEDNSERTKVVQKAQPQASQPTEKKGDFLQELAKLKRMAGLPTELPPVTSSVSTRPTTSLPGPRSTLMTSSARSSRLSAASTAPTRSVVTGSAQRTPSVTRTSRQSYSGTPQSMANNSATTTTTPNTSKFSRADGGRSSMRSNAPTTPTSQKRPPFRAGGAPQPRFSLGASQQQREAEMNAWLRRKDYNPMKAAAEAKKQKDVKSSTTDLVNQSGSESESAREEQFTSNRSMSFHVGPQKLPAQPQQQQRLSRRRSQESLAEDAATQASQKVIAEYSRGVVEDINKLSIQSARGSEKTSGLARAVDMLSQKCKKSIELIRSQNKGCLSVSVEDLLSVAADPPRQNESLHEQLDRLSDAFDAVQRYLEQYALDGRDSPLPEHFYEDHDLDPRSADGAYRKKVLAQEDDDETY